MQLNVQSVRFSDQQWRLIGRAAAADGLSASAFVREFSFASAVVWAYTSTHSARH